MKRIQNGELVELSAAGKKLNQNHNVLGLFGMVVGYKGKRERHAYQIDWYKKDGTTYRFPMARYEIKRFKGAK